MSDINWEIPIQVFFFFLENLAKFPISQDKNKNCQIITIKKKKKQV